MYSDATTVGIDMKRCLCIHSLSQLIDITLQSLLYQRQIIPEPASIFKKGDSHASEQFSDLYNKISRILQETFRSVNYQLIREFVILIGGTPFSPKEIYRILVPLCGAHESNRNDGCDSQNGGCTSVCEELSAKERRLVFSAVTLSKIAVGHFENCAIPGKTDKVFLFIRTRGQLNTFVEGLSEDEGFELPADDIQRRRKIRLLLIQVHSPCCTAITRTSRASSQCADGLMDPKTDEDENVPLSFWYRMAPFFTNVN